MEKLSTIVHFKLDLNIFIIYNNSNLLLNETFFIVPSVIERTAGWQVEI